MANPIKSFLRQLRKRFLAPYDCQLQNLNHQVKQLELLLTEHLHAERHTAQNEILEAKQRVKRLELLLTEHPHNALYALEKANLHCPAVSIIMPTWNRASLISDAIRSVQAQYFTHWELLVIDDGSDDNTEEVIAALSSDTRISYHKKSRGGPSSARNLALQLAKGKYIAYLDSDNLWYPGFLAAAIAAFYQNPAYECVYGAMVTEHHFDGNRNILFEAFDRPRLLEGNYIGMSSIVHSRELFTRYGGFDESLTCVEDWDLLLSYTRDQPAYALPALAVRYRVLDNKRITDTVPSASSVNKVKHKWKQHS